MAGKARLFGDEETLQEILEATKPAEIKALGRKVRNFDEAKWVESRSDIVLQGNIHKFEQNPEMLNELLSTGDKEIVEASPVDRIWGIGMSAKNASIVNPKNWKGLNLLGKAIMEARTILGERAKITK